MNQSRSLLCGKGGQFESVCLFYLLFTTSKAVLIKQAMVSSVKFYQQAIAKVSAPKITTSRSTHPSCTREYAFDQAPCPQNFLRMGFSQHMSVGDITFQGHLCHATALYCIWAQLIEQLKNQTWNQVKTVKINAQIRYQYHQ